MSETINRQGGRAPSRQKRGAIPASKGIAQAAEPWKMPPLAKIYEALGALGDGRVLLEDELHASVLSSDRTRVYQVESSADDRIWSSNDNGSYWQGYIGYPAIAVMLKRSLFPVAAEVVNALTGIAWKELNRSFRNDYGRTVEEVLRRAQQRGFDTKMIVGQAEAVLSKLTEFAPLHGPRRRPARPGR